MRKCLKASILPPNSSKFRAMGVLLVTKSRKKDQIVEAFFLKI